MLQAVIDVFCAGLLIAALFAAVVLIGKVMKFAGLEMPDVERGSAGPGLLPSRSRSQAPSGRPAQGFGSLGKCGLDGGPDAQSHSRGTLIGDAKHGYQVRCDTCLVLSWVIPDAYAARGWLLVHQGTEKHINTFAPGGEA